MMPLKQFVSRKENGYFYLASACSVLLIAALLISIIGIFYVIFFSLFFFVTHGLLIGNLRSNAVRVTDVQFPELHAMVTKTCVAIGARKVPEIYLLQSGGALNAFATRFLGRDFVVIYSGVLEMAYEQGAEAVEFIVAHEVAHVVLRHTIKKVWTAPAMFIPFIGTAYSRACEYSADAIGAHISPSGAARGLCVLAAGRHLSHRVDVVNFANQSLDANGFWEWLAEHTSTHPTLPKRLTAVARRKSA